MLVPNPLDIEEIDRSLEIATLIRSGEIGFARDYRAGTAFGADGDRYRLDAFTLGLLDAMAQHASLQADSYRLLVYLFKLIEHGPGKSARLSTHEMLALGEVPLFSRYVSGGRRHVLSTLAGRSPEVGRFAQLLSDELASR